MFAWYRVANIQEGHQVAFVHSNSCRVCRFVKPSCLRAIWEGRGGLTVDLPQPRDSILPRGFPKRVGPFWLELKGGYRSPYPLFNNVTRLQF